MVSRYYSAEPSLLLNSPEAEALARAQLGRAGKRSPTEKGRMKRKEGKRTMKERTRRILAASLAAPLALASLCLPAEAAVTLGEGTTPWGFTEIKGSTDLTMAVNEGNQNNSNVPITKLYDGLVNGSSRWHCKADNTLGPNVVGITQIGDSSEDVGNKGAVLNLNYERTTAPEGKTLKGNEVEITLASAQEVSGISYFARQDNNPNGTFDKINVYVKGETGAYTLAAENVSLLWPKLDTTVSDSRHDARREVVFAQKQQNVKSIKVEVLSAWAKTDSVSTTPAVSGEEITVLTEGMTAPATYNVGAKANNASLGEVDLTVDYVKTGQKSDGSLEARVPEAKKAVLKATAKEGSKFVKWTKEGDDAFSSRCDSIVVDTAAAGTYVAVFEQSAVETVKLDIVEAKLTSGTVGTHNNAAFLTDGDKWNSANYYNWNKDGVVTFDLGEDVASLDHVALYLYYSYVQNDIREYKDLKVSVRDSATTEVASGMVIYDGAVDGSRVSTQAPFCVSVPDNTTVRYIDVTAGNNVMASTGDVKGDDTHLREFEVYGVPNPAGEKCAVTVVDLDATAGEVTKNNASYTTEEFDFGAELALKATAKDGYTFKYWYDKDAGKVVTTNNTVHLVVTGSRNLTPVFVQDTGVRVTFKLPAKFANKVIQDGAELNAPDVTPIAGYVFSGWKSTDPADAKVYIANENVPGTTAIYEAVLVANGNCSIIVVGGTLDGGTEQYGGAYYSSTVNRDTVVTAKAKVEDANGKKFAGWFFKTSNTEKVKVSNDLTYRFIAKAATTSLVAEYEDTAPTETEPLLAMPIHRYDVDTLRVQVLYDTVGNETIVEKGVLVKIGTEAATADEMKLNAAGVKKFCSTTVYASGSYTLNAKLPVGKTTTYVGYLVYKDANGNYEAKYTDVLSEAVPAN